jgi:Conjugal transfer protein TraD
VSQAERRADTRKKIILGGLFIKAGLDRVDAMVLLGLLLDGKPGLDDPREVQRLLAVGRAAVQQGRYDP